MTKAAIVSVARSDYSVLRPLGDCFRQIGVCLGHNRNWHHLSPEFRIDGRSD